MVKGLKKLKGHTRKATKKTETPRYRVWECKIVVPFSAVLPQGFDTPPRSAAKNAVLSAGIPIIACLSGWSGELTYDEMECLERTGRID